ncbi:MAG: hypothetical protein KIT57_01515 [Blastocatellales bacterium]|nr:hypothetical protein [Blastocatellales bacterium]
MGGGVRIIDPTKSLIFDEQMLEPGMKFSSARLEAVYSIPVASAEVSLIISNTTESVLAVQGEGRFLGANGRYPIDRLLKPHETRVVELPPGLVKITKAGAISLSHNGGAGALLAKIHIQEPGKGFSATVNFSDPSKGKTTQYHGAGLRLGSINGKSLAPSVVVRNLSGTPTTVTGRVVFATEIGGEGKVNISRTTLNPGEIKLLDVSHPRLLRSDISTAGLELEYEGAPGSVIADALSITSDGNQVFGLPLKDPKGGMSSTGGYPWFIGDSSSTVVFIKNTTDEPQFFHLDVVYPGGKWGSNLRTLAPHQTFSLDIREIRDAQEKGVDGITIPQNADVGHVYWSSRSLQTKTLIGRAETVDFAVAISSTYECQCPCAGSYADSTIEPAGVNGFVGDTQQFIAREQNYSCFGGTATWYNVPNNWVSFIAVSS